MRLTLRTLLAYMDHVLDARATEAMKGKVGSSPLAASLMQRIRAGMKRKQLPAPPIIGRGLGGDPNTVADYLDNSLDTERVPEFERICMESDIQLTEVAACHQILTVAVEQTALFSSELHRRVMDLPNQPLPPIRKRKVDPKSNGKTNSPASNSPATRATTGISPTENTTSRTLPGNSGSQHRLDASHHPQEPDQRSSLNGSSTLSTSAKELGVQGIDLADHRLAEKVPEYLRGRATSAWRQLGITACLLVLLALVGWLSIGSFSQVRNLMGSNPIAPPSVNEPNTPANEAIPNRIDQPEEVAKEKPDPQAANSNGEEAIEPDPIPPAIPASTPGLAQWMPETREQVESLVLVSGKESGLWRRLAVGDQVDADTRIVVPPAFTTTMQLAGNIAMEVRSTSVFSLSARGGNQGPSLRAEQLHALFHLASDQTQGSLGLQLQGDEQVEIQFGSSDGLLAIEVVPFWNLGPDYLLDHQRVPAAKFLAIRGQISLQWRQGEANQGAPIELPPGEAIGWLPANTPIRFAAPQLPGWIQGSAEPPIMQRAREDLHRAMLNTKSSELLSQIEELAMNRRPEVAALATRVLCVLGDWKGVVGESSRLRSPQLRSYWYSIAEELRRSICMNPGHWQSLVQSWSNHEESLGLPMLALLAGWNPEQVEQGPSAGWPNVDWPASFEHQDLAVRVLAGYQLRRVTGSDHGYQADQANTESTQLVRKLFASGKLRYAIPPVPFPEATRP